MAFILELLFLVLFGGVLIRALLELGPEVIPRGDPDVMTSSEQHGDP
jgi:hypothetical protein